MTNEVSPIDTWLAQGREIAAQRLNYDWLMADWMAAGKAAGHLSRLKYNFLSECVGLPPRRLKDALKAAVTFPANKRQPTISVDHHAAIVSLPEDEALPLLQRAAADRLSVTAMRQAVTQHRFATGERFDDEDTDSTLATLTIRAWNRATPEAREMAFELFKIAADRGLGVVDEDEAVDA